MATLVPYLYCSIHTPLELDASIYPISPTKTQAHAYLEETLHVYSAYSTHS